MSRLQASKILKNNAVIREKLREAEADRLKIETRLRKRNFSIPDETMDFLNDFPTDNAELPLEQFVSRFDLDLLQKAQAQLTQDKEREPSLRNSSQSGIKSIQFGCYEITACYPSHFPREYNRLEKVYVCEFCLKFLRQKLQIQRHMFHCTVSNPPGEKIYEKGDTAVWQVDGDKEKIYCQHLCLIAMLFLNYKTLYKDVQGFLFYVLTFRDDDGYYHMTSYFSKEKAAHATCNLSCLVVLPPYRSRGLGQFLIDLSYVLSKKLGKTGTPEHPLSDMGLKAYRKYWRGKVVEYISDVGHLDSVTVKEMSQQTGIHQNDIISTLQYYGMIKHWRANYWIVKEKEVNSRQKKRKTVTKDKDVQSLVVDPAFLIENVTENGHDEI